MIVIHYIFYELICNTFFIIGIKSSGKVSYVITIFPYVVLVIFIVYLCQKPGMLT